MKPTIKKRLLILTSLIFVSIIIVNSLILTHKESFVSAAGANENNDEEPADLPEQPVNDLINVKKRGDFSIDGILTGTEGPDQVIIDPLQTFIAVKLKSWIGQVNTKTGEGQRGKYDDALIGRPCDDFVEIITGEPLKKLMTLKMDLKGGDDTVNLIDHNGRACHAFTFVQSGRNDDKINLAGGKDVVDLGDGDDYANSRKNDDIVCGRKGKDVIFTGDHDDKAVGEEDKDLITMFNPSTDIGAIRVGSPGDTAEGNEDLSQKSPKEDEVKGCVSTKGDNPDTPAKETNYVTKNAKEKCNVDYLDKSLNIKCSEVEVASNYPRHSTPGDDNNPPKPPIPGDDDQLA